jgi:hypothetical protein
MAYISPRVIWPALVLASYCMPAAAQAPVESAVTGLVPHQRPADAPILGQFSPELGWRARALNGVSEPVPPTLRFLDFQGAWYTPFDRPGMPGRYDLRGWHAVPHAGR